MQRYMVPELNLPASVYLPVQLISYFHEGAVNSLQARCWGTISRKYLLVLDFHPRFHHTVHASIIEALLLWRSGIGIFHGEKDPVVCNVLTLVFKIQEFCCFLHANSMFLVNSAQYVALSTVLGIGLKTSQILLCFLRTYSLKIHINMHYFMTWNADYTFSMLTILKGSVYNVMYSFCLFIERRWCSCAWARGDRGGTEANGCFLLSQAGRYEGTIDGHCHYCHK